MTNRDTSPHAAALLHVDDSYHGRLNAETLVKAYPAMSNKMIINDVHQRFGTPDTWNDEDHPLNPKNFLTPMQKAHGQQVEFAHVVDENHTPDIGFATRNDGYFSQNPRPICFKCDTAKGQTLYEEHDFSGRGNRVLPVHRPTCNTCGDRLMIDDPIKGTWKHDPGYGDDPEMAEGLPEGAEDDRRYDTHFPQPADPSKFDLGKAQRADAHHTATPIIDPFSPENY
ncbi:hypothetical protein UFOVP111_134 [uncultured Caudovirales phage]|uniref:Uncharacterized protein n=1 Tax=uncultured Caudovirales phage TaxID=2100421 RepID=A0A6J5L649_9CAUD|nr:hypothetical protein UFOVP111_134 [uncultured Caudovirales phage]